MLADVFGARPLASVTHQTWPVTDPRWYESLGTRSDSGILVGPEVALSIGVVFRAVNVLAHAVATVPLVIYRRVGENVERATDHPQYRLLHDAPNAWQTSFSFRHLMVSRAILWGNFYAEIVPGYGGSIAQLVPLPPSTTRVVDQLGDGRRIYCTRDQLGDGSYGPERRVGQENVLHVMGFSKDGKDGVPLTEFARNALGLALSAEKHGSLFMKRGAQFSGLLTAPGEMTNETRSMNEKAWERAKGGTAGSGSVPLLTGGMDFKPISATNRDSQWLEARDFQIAELGPRFLGVPGILCGYPDKTATYASASEMTLAFVKHGVMPLTDNIRAELNRSVVTGFDGGEFYCDFILEGLLRGDIKTRYEAHRIAVMTGWKSRNEVRKLEGDNPGPAPLDEFFEPLNLGVAGEYEKPSGRQAPMSPQRDRRDDQRDDDETDARLLGIAREAARALVRREVQAVVGSGDRKGAAVKYAADPAAWRTWLAEFYGEHAKAVSSRLRVPWDAAEGYCLAQRAALEADLHAAERFESAAVPRLLALVHEGRAA